MGSVREKHQNNITPPVIKTGTFTKAPITIGLIGFAPWFVDTSLHIPVTENCLIFTHFRIFPKKKEPSSMDG